MMGTEADVHFEFYRHLANAIDEKPDRGQLYFGKPTPEKSVNGGFADILIPDKRGNPLVVIEAKKQVNGDDRRGIDPYSPEVIRQAHTYASQLGADYFATFNGRLLVLFETFESGIPLLQRKSRAYRIRDLAAFASSFLDEVAAVQSKKLRWDPADTAFVGRLASFHDRLCAVMGSEVGSRLNAKVAAWARSQGWELTEHEALTRFVTQAAYLYMNKIVFHKILRDQGEYPLPKLCIPSKSDVRTVLAKAYLQVVDEIDFEAIYQHDPLFDEVPLSDEAVTELRDFIEELESYDLSTFDRDVIGRIYERVIPESERLALGQYYTPPEIIELITHLTVRDSTCKVLDPACGSGGFLVASYNRLASLCKDSGKDPDHARLLNQLFGIDINRFPAHLSAINLSLRNLSEKTTKVNIEVNDFFHVNPGQKRTCAEKITPSGSRTVELSFPNRFGAVVANPPYIRHKWIPDKDLVRAHLNHGHTHAAKPELDDQSDMYCYFFTHAAEFLERGSRMGFITSNMWLAVQYGKGLRQFLLDRFKVLYVVQFWKRAFEGQLVPTCVTILEKCDVLDERRRNLTKFVMLKKSMKLDDLLNLLEERARDGVVISSEEARSLSIRQGRLTPDEQWHRYLLAPPLYWQIIQNPKMTELKRIAAVDRGETTGCNEFFVLDDMTVKNRGLDARYLQPFYGSPKDITGLSPTSSPRSYLLDVGALVAKLVASNKQVTKDTQKEIARAEKIGKEEFLRYALENKLKVDKPIGLKAHDVRAIGLLKESGNNALYEYVLWGTQQGYFARPTLSASGSAWFVNRETKKGRLLSVKNVRGRPRFPLMSTQVSVVNTMYLIIPNRNEDLEVLAGYLNSSVGKLLFEVHGRIQYGGLVQVTVDDLERFLIIDPGTLTKPERTRIVDAFRKLTSTGEHEDRVPEILVELDKAVLAPFGLEARAEDLARIAKALSESRQEQKEYECPVETEQMGSFEISGGIRIGSGRQSTID